MYNITQHDRPHKKGCVCLINGIRYPYLYYRSLYKISTLFNVLFGESAMCNKSTPQEYYQSSQPHTIINTVLIGIVFFSGTIVPVEYYQIHCFDPINLYP